jgi:ligand-binding SRPBCC domain-containing protein
MTFSHEAPMPAIRVSTLFLCPPHELWPTAVDAKALSRFGADRSLSLTTPGPLRVGSRLEWTIGGHFPGLHATAEVTELVALERFSASAAAGSFPVWQHVRSLRPDGQRSCWLEDRVFYRPPGRAIAGWLDRYLVRDVVVETLMATHRAAARCAGFKTLRPEGEWQPRPPADFLGAAGVASSALAPAHDLETAR